MSSEQESRMQTPDALSAVGYRQRLDRSVGQFAAFAAGVSLVSILTGVFLLFALGYGTAGPGYWWTWLVVFAGQLTVALIFAELAARYPIAGSVYQWTKIVGGRTAGWLAGWVVLGGTVVGCASIALAAQVVLPEISSVFQFVGDGSGEHDLSTNAVILGSVFILLALLANSLGVRALTRVNSTGVAIELVAAVVLIVLFFFAAKRGPAVVTETFDLGAGHQWGYFGALLVAAIASAYVIIGFDTASSLAEETRDPERNAPRAVIRAVVASGVIGGLLILGALMAAKDLGAEEMSTIGLPFVVKDVLGDVIGTILLIGVMIAISVCLMAVMAQGTRMAFAMARDRGLPASALLARLSARSSTPIAPNVVIAVLAIALLAINIRQAQIIAIVTSLAAVMFYLGYLAVTTSVLLRRVRGAWPPREDAPRERFSLGRWGLPINVVAVLYGAAMSINLLWPRGEIYNPVAPFHWYFKYGGVLFVALFSGLGLAYYLLVVRHRSGVLEGHEAEPAREPAGAAA